MIADIFNQVSIGSGTSVTAIGSAFDTSRLSRTTVFISALSAGSGTSTGSQLYVNVEASYNGSDWFVVDNKRFESGPSTQTDVFSYSIYFPWMRTQVIGSNVGAFDTQTVITGRGV